MNDPFEKYILDQKEDLDVFEPSKDLWSRIHPELDFPAEVENKKKNKYNFTLKIAATVLLLLGLGSLFVLDIKSPIPTKSLAQNKTENQAPLSEFEAYYQNMISARKAEVVAYTDHGLEADHTLFDQLERLQDLYGDLRTELPQSEDSEMVVNAMAQNLMMQIEILNQQLAILEHIKSMQNGKEKQL